MSPGMPPSGRRSGGRLIGGEIGARPLPGFGKPGARFVVRHSGQTVSGGGTGPRARTLRQRPQSHSVSPPPIPPPMPRPLMPLGGAGMSGKPGCPGMPLIPVPGRPEMPLMPLIPGPGSPGIPGMIGGPPRMLPAGLPPIVNVRVESSPTAPARKPRRRCQVEYAVRDSFVSPHQDNH